jgi:hypothetical protein
MADGAAKLSRAVLGARVGGRAWPMRRRAMLIDTVLWFILAGIIAIVPCGCILTRRRTETPPPAAH